jgi:phage-related protein
MSPNDKPIVWLHGEIQTPPFSREARIECGFFLRLLQQGLNLSLPHSRPMPSIGHRCNELRITDKNLIWRIIYRIDHNAIVLLDVFEKKSQKTPKNVIDVCQKRLISYDNIK